MKVTMIWWKNYNGISYKGVYVIDILDIYISVQGKGNED